MSTDEQRARLEYLRGQLQAECISWGELAELQELAPHIEPGDVELLEAAGVPEFSTAEWSNEDRGSYGARAVEAGTPDYDADDPRTNVVDTLANIQHFCHQQRIDFADALASAERHFQAEAQR